MSSRRMQGLRDLARDVRRSVRREDLALDSAGVTFYSLIAVVPLLLLSLAGASLVLGEVRLDRLGGEVAALLPNTLGARAYAQDVVRAGTDLNLVQVLACVLPATLYGEGLIRAFDRLTREPSGRLPRGWRGRLLTLPVIGGTPVFVLVTAVLGAWTAGALAQRDAPTSLGIYVAFLLSWVQLSVLLLLVYGLLARRSIGARALLWGALGTASVVAGFLLGFVLFLSLDLPLGTPFGGFFAVGLLVAVGLWGFLLHMLVLVGYAVTLRLQARDGHPTGPVTGMEAQALSTGAEPVPLLEGCDPSPPPQEALPPEDQTPVVVRG